MAVIVVSSVFGASRSANGDEDIHDRLDEHDALATKELTGHGATVVEDLDDGVLALFPVPDSNPVRVVACALRIVEHLEEDGVAVRLGLHAGEVSMTRKGARGDALTTALEVMRNAAPGEVLVSGACRQLVTRTGQRFTDLGEHELDVADDPVHLFRAERLTGPRFGP